MRPINPHVRRLRQEMTDAERVMWFQLRGRRLGGAKFKRQWTIGPFVVDFCCIEKRLIVEIDGGQHSPERDAHGTAALEGAGYQIVRYWNNEVNENLEGVLADLMARLGTHAHPNPLPQAGEGAA
jgi:adenine-specific DNA-methyltransferase